MVLRLTNDEVEILRAALAKHVRGLRDETRAHCTGYSPVGIGLCRQRETAEALLDRVDSPYPEQPLAA